MEKLEALGSQLSIQGVIGGAAITALTGALAGTLAIGGVAGALMGGGLALAGLVALVAIAAIGYAIYQYRGEIKEGALDAGKAIKSLVKDLIDKLPTFRARENNFAKLNSDLLEQHRKSTDNEEKATLNNKIEIIKMLQNKEQRSAIEKLVEEGEIKFPEMKKLIEKGISTHETDKKALEELVGGFQSAITKDDKTVESFVQMVNAKVNEMKPKSQVDDPSSKQVSPEGIEKL